MTKKERFKKVVEWSWRDMMMVIPSLITLMGIWLGYLANSLTYCIIDSVLVALFFLIWHPNRNVYWEKVK